LNEVTELQRIMAARESGNGLFQSSYPECRWRDWENHSDLKRKPALTLDMSRMKARCKRRR